MNRLTRVFALLILGTMAQAATAADLRVRIFERGASKPLEGVAVCVGTQARIDQFGARLTDENGYAAFEALPGAQLVVTAAKLGYKGEQEMMVTSNTNRMLVISLTTGGGGPDCTVSGATVSSVKGLRVTRFALDGGAAVTSSRRVTLNNTVSGSVTQYRASEHADFSGAEWKDYSTAPGFELSPGAGTRRVYFQVRKHSSINDAVVETLSPVTSDTINLGR